VDYRKDPEAWADALLDQYRTTPRRDPERDREAAARALRDLSPVACRTLTRDGREPDLETIARIQRNSRRHAIFQKWEAIFTIVGVALLWVFGLVWSSAWSRAASCSRSRGSRRVLGGDRCFLAALVRDPRRSKCH
jgi:hypothetical protein